jgi:hypothetical protein
MHRAPAGFYIPHAHNCKLNAQGGHVTLLMFSPDDGLQATMTAPTSLYYGGMGVPGIMSLHSNEMATVNPDYSCARMLDSKQPTTDAMSEQNAVQLLRSCDAGQKNGHAANTVMSQNRSA